MAISGEHCFWYSHPDAKKAVAHMSLQTQLPVPSAECPLNEAPQDPEKADTITYDDWKEICTAADLQ
eukprot:6717430-Karenia_brevis.AAC.1